MGLQSSGSISLNNIAGEFGGSAPHSLSEYYGVASGVPASGAISLANFYGTSSSPLGFISLDSASGLPSNIRFGSTTSIQGSLSNIVAVKKGSNEYIVALTNGTFTSDGLPNMVVITPNSSYNSYSYYNACGTHQMGTVYTQGGSNNSYGSIYRTETRMNHHGYLVHSEPFNAVTLWIQSDRSYSNPGVYRDYVSSPSEAPNSDYWRPCSSYRPQETSTNFPNQSWNTYSHRLGILGYASSETSTIALPHIPVGDDIGYYYQSTVFRPLTLAVYRTTNGYDYYLNSTTIPFPNESYLVHYGSYDSDEHEYVAWKPSDIAYGNGVYVMTRVNWATSYRADYWSGTPDRRMGLLISTDDGQTFNNTQLRYGNGSGYFGRYPSPTGFSAVAFNHDAGVFIAIGVNTTSYIYESTDGINWEKIYISGTTNQNAISSPRSMTYGNGMFIIERNDYAFYSTDNGRNWTSISNTPSGAIVAPNYHKDLSYFVSTGYHSGTNNIYQYYRFE